MSDIYSKDKRSDIMSKISGAETKPEILVRKHLFSQGFRYRKNVKSLPGKPDIVLPKYKTVIFVHGCFWHGHHCKAGKLPKTNKDFWKQKIADTKCRDINNKEKLNQLGWRVLTIWQCEIDTIDKRKQKFTSLLNQFRFLS